MYAIVRLAGNQVVVKPDETVRVPRLDVEVGSLIRCDDVLLFSDGKDIRVGQPLLEDVTVRAKVIGHGRMKKVVVFKMKRRKNYRRKKGQRRNYTDIMIKEISG